MKVSTATLVMALASAKAQNNGPLNFGTDNQCVGIKKAISNTAKQLVADNRSHLKGLFPDRCLTDTKIQSYLEGELHQLYQSCYYNDKLEPLNNGDIRYFTTPKKTGQYDPNVQPNLLKVLKQHGDKFLIKQIGPDFAAVSKSAPAETLQIFNNFNPSDTRLDRPETVSSMMKFLFSAGKGEVPDFDRALYALSAETMFTGFLQNAKLDKPFDIPTDIVVTAVKNDPKLSANQKKDLLLKLENVGDKLNIGKGADTLGNIFRVAIESIIDECPSSHGQLPMREKSLTGSSAYYPMQWRLNSVLESTQRKDEL